MSDLLLVVAVWVFLVVAYTITVAILERRAKRKEKAEFYWLQSHMELQNWLRKRAERKGEDESHEPS